MNINTAIKMIDKKISLIADIQMVIVDYLGNQDKEFRTNFVMTALTNDALRDDFTKFLNQTETDDNIKIQMTEINEMFLSMKEEE
tara:strand:+ start:101 stop:355 length:255 start_codon:yes stop_codon:yes gene_type:complete